MPRGRKKSAASLMLPLRIGAVAHEIAEAFAALKPIAIKSRHREHVRNIHLTDKAGGRSRHLQQEINSLHVHGGARLVRVKGSGHAADEKRLQVRIFAAEHGVNADEFLLKL